MSMDLKQMAANMENFLKSYEEAQNEAGRYRSYASKLIEARNELEAANERIFHLQADCERFARVNDSLIEENEDLKKKLEQLRAQVKRDERIYNTVMALLRKEGHDVPALALETAFIVAAMELRDKE